MTPNNWPRVFTLLSMDVVLECADLMALPITASTTALRDVLRAEILRVRRIDPDAPLPNRVYKPQATLDAIERALGTKQSEAVHWWANEIYETSTSDHVDLSHWFDVLRRLYDEPARWAKLDLPGDISRAACDRFRLAIDPTPINDRFAHVNAQPLSDWDLHMYALNLFDDDDDVLANGPQSSIYPAAMNAQGYAWWCWLHEQLDDEQQSAFRLRALDQCEDDPYLTHVTELARPQDMEVRFDRP